jgi:hypothetical protein
MAVETSVKQMALTRDTAPGGFMERFVAILANQAGAVLSEAAGTPDHQGRAFYAQKVTQNPQQAATVGGPIIVMGVNIVNATTYDEATKVATCTVDDLSFQSQVMTFWNRLAGLDTPA